MKTSRVVLVLSLTIAVSAYATGKFTDWSTPTNLGDMVNSPFRE